MYRILFLFFAFFALQNIKAHDFCVDGNYYTLISTSNRTVAFSGTEKEGVLEIPSQVTIENRQFTVTEIEKMAFYGKKNIVSVVIPSTITTLGNLSLAHGDFESVQLPSELTEIGESAFYNCTNLKSIDIPDNVTVIGHFAFRNCSSLAKIKLPKSLKRIGAAAFVSCASLKGNLIIPSEMYFDTDYHNHGHYVAFPDCSQLDTLIFEDSKKELYVYEGQLWASGEKQSQELAKATNLDYIYIGRPKIYRWGKDVQTRKVEYGDMCNTQYAYFGVGTKNNCYTDFSSKRLEEVVFGKNIKKISSYKSSTNLRSVIVKSMTPPVSEGFSNDTYIKGTLYVPKGCISVYQNADVWKEFWNIEEYNEANSESTSNLSSIENRNISINSKKGIVSITGLDVNEIVSFYSLEGKLLGVKKSKGNSLQYFTDCNVLIVRIGNSSIKVSVF